MSGTKMIGAVGAAVALAGLLVAASVRGPRPQAPASEGDSDQSVSIDPRLELRSKGDTAAPIRIIELSDFQCPWCRKFTEETLPALEAEYIDTGKAHLVFINLPVPSIHPNAPAAHEFAMCAASQGHFWPVHDLLFRHQPAWDSLETPGPFFLGLADSVGLERGDLTNCLTNGSMRALVSADVNTARRGGVTGTPTFVIEGGRIGGFVDMEALRPILDSIYLAKTSG